MSKHGTMCLIIVRLDNEDQVSQLCTWDGYALGQGFMVYAFARMLGKYPSTLRHFKTKVRSSVQFDLKKQRGLSASTFKGNVFFARGAEKSPEWFHPNYGADVLMDIFDKPAGIELMTWDAGFKKEVDYIYTIDLDHNRFTATKKDYIFSRPLKDLHAADELVTAFGEGLDYGKNWTVG